MRGAGKTAPVLRACSPHPEERRTPGTPLLPASSLTLPEAGLGAAAEPGRQLGSRWGSQGAAAPGALRACPPPASQGHCRPARAGTASRRAPIPVPSPRLRRGPPTAAVPALRRAGRGSGAALRRGRGPRAGGRRSLPPEPRLWGPCRRAARPPLRLAALPATGGAAPGGGRDNAAAQPAGTASGAPPPPPPPCPPRPRRPPPAKEAAARRCLRRRRRRGPERR